MEILRSHLSLFISDNIYHVTYHVPTNHEYPYIDLYPYFTRHESTDNKRPFMDL